MDKNIKLNVKMSLQYIFRASNATCDCINDDKERDGMKLQLENINKNIRKNNILHDINLTLEGGKVYGLKDKNGCGKTMLMRTIAGLLKPTSGRVVINDEVLWKDICFPRSMGVLIENPSFLNGYTGFENLKIIASIKGIIGNEDIKATLEKVGLDPDDRRKYRKYSLGMKQKLGIACAVMENPDIVILDEPINAIDQSGVEKVRKIFIIVKKAIR